MRISLNWPNKLLHPLVLGKLSHTLAHMQRGTRFEAAVAVAVAVDFANANSNVD